MQLKVRTHCIITMSAMAVSRPRFRANCRAYYRVCDVCCVLCADG